MALIHLVGPNAIGKTTALKRWLARYPQITALFCDITTKVVRGVTSKAPELKGDAVSKEANVKLYRATGGVVVWDSARTDSLRYAHPVDIVILLTCQPETMGKHLQTRCAANGKQFRSNYWTLDKLGYESSRRYLNIAEKRLDPSQVYHFEIEDQARDWAQIDEWFYKLYRRLHNQQLANAK